MIQNLASSVRHREAGDPAGRQSVVGYRHPAPFERLLVAALLFAPVPVFAAQSPAQQTPPAKPVSPPVETIKPAAKPPAAPAPQQSPDQTDPVATAWKRITEATSTGTIRSRAGALQALAGAGDRPEILQILLQGMEDRDPRIRKATVSALGQMQAHEAIPRLRQALDDNSPTVRVAAARSLWEMKDYSGSDLLIRIVLRRAPAEEARLKQEWQEAVQKVDNPSAVVLLALEQGIGFLPGPSFLAIPLFRKITTDKSAPARATAAKLLGDEPKDAAIAALEQALVDPEPLVRAAAAVALGKSKRPEEIIQIAPLLRDRRAAVRLAAAVAIARLSPPGSGPAPAPAPHP